MLAWKQPLGSGVRLYGDSQYRPGGHSPLRRSLHSRWDKLARSGFVTVVGLLLTLGLCGALWIAHVRGRIHRFTTTQEVAEQAIPAVRLGGQELVHLTRFEVGGSLQPEFTGITVAPGYGMLLLQATLNLPGRGEVPLLLGTREADLSAGSKQANGGEFSARVLDPDLKRGLESTELIAGRPATQQESTAMPGGSRIEAHFSPDISRPGGDLLRTGVETVTSASISNRGLELAISAKNNSTTPHRMVLAWQARVLAPQDGLHGLSLQPVLSAASEGASHAAIQLGTRDVDESYSGFEHGYLSNGPEMLLHNRTDSYTLRFRALTPSIHSLHIQASRQDNSVLLGFSTDQGRVPTASRDILAPGETMQWRLRIEAVSASDSTQAP